MKKLFPIASALLLLASCAFAQPTPVVVVIPTQHFTGQALNNLVTVESLNTPYSTSQALVAGSIWTLQPTNGIASTNLFPGDYRVTIKGMQGYWDVTVYQTNGPINAAASLKYYQGVPANQTFLWTNPLSGITIIYTNGAGGSSAFALSSANSTNFWGKLSVTNLPAGLSSSNYVGTFAGDGTAVTNVARATSSVNSTNFWGILSPTNLPAGIASSNYVGTFSGNGAAVVGVLAATSSTNFYGLLSPTNLPPGIASSNYVGAFTGNGAGLTNLSIAASTNAVNATNFWGQLTSTNLPAGLSTSNYVGQFAGTGSGLTNVPTATNAIAAVNSTNFWGSLNPTNLPAGLSTSNFVGQFAGTGSSLTNLATATNAVNATNFWGVLSPTNVPTAMGAVNATNFFGLLSTTNLPVGISTSNYVGTFTGNASGLSNISVTAAANSTNFWGKLSATNLPNGLSTSNFVGVFTGNGAGISNITATATNVPLPGVIYYVGTNGSSGNTGLNEREPLDLRSGLARMTNWNTVVMLRGHYWSDGNYYTIPTGLSNATLRAQTKWQSGILNSTNTNFAAFNLMDSSGSPQNNHFTVEGIVISNSIAYDGLDTGRCAYCLITNCWITHNYLNGIGASTVGSTNNIVDSNLIEWNGLIGPNQYHGIYISGQHNIVRNNVVRNNGGFGIHAYTGYAGYTVDDMYIYNNLVYSNDAGSCGIVCWNGADPGGLQPGTNYIFGNTILDGISTRYGDVSISNNIILPPAGASTLPVRLGGSVPAVVHADYNVGTNAMTGGAHDVITTFAGLAFVNPSKGLYWLKPSSAAAGVACPQVFGPVDFFSDYQLQVADVGMARVRTIQTGDTRTLDPSPGYGADYWATPETYTFVGTFVGNGAGVTNVASASNSTNFWGVLSSTNMPPGFGSSLSNLTLTNITIWAMDAGKLLVKALPAGVNLFSVDTNAAFSHLNLSGDTILSYSGGPVASDSLTIGTHNGTRLLANSTTTSLYDNANHAQMALLPGETDNRTNVMVGWDLWTTNNAHVLGTFTNTGAASVVGALYTTTHTNSGVMKSTGNIYGNVVGDVTGNVTGNLTGNASTASSASSATSAGTATSATTASALSSQFSGNIDGLAHTLTGLSGLTATNPVFRVAASSDALVYYDNGQVALDIPSSGAFAFKDRNGNATVYYLMTASYDLVAATVTNGAGMTASGVTGTRLYDDKGTAGLTVRTNAVNVLTNLVVSGTISGLVPVAAKTANYTVVTADSGTYFNNNGAVSPQTNTLPTSVAGMKFALSCVVAQNTALKANGSDTIRSVGGVSAAGGLLFSSTIGSTAEIFCPAAGTWYVIATNGTWTIQ